MVILKKIRAATLMETLTAVLIVVVVFSIASASLQNIYGAEVKNNDDLFRNRLKELAYLAKNNKLSYPFLEDTTAWNIYLEKNEDEIKLTAQWKKGRSTITQIWQNNDKI
ncbi:hypothetical protein [Gilvibacter sediminis]|uniref:hypothetical protein n=1 Tax=Gilvibacter sediminis TaxID=379071 RepID=UPI002350E57A|nr:hypothetical protein [Gilvibacter sediminis]MDC7996889.1 hypothetical protein [Gilvibacter sediminis]